MPLQWKNTWYTDLKLLPDKTSSGTMTHSNPSHGNLLPKSSRNTLSGNASNFPNWWTISSPPYSDYRLSTTTPTANALPVVNYGRTQTMYYDALLLTIIKHALLLYKPSTITLWHNTHQQSYPNYCTPWQHGKLDTWWWISLPNWPTPGERTHPAGSDHELSCTAGSIGWDQFFWGRITTQWATPIHTYYHGWCSGVAYYTPDQWMHTTIKAIWTLSLTLWQQRNAKYHGENGLVLSKECQWKATALKAAAVYQETLSTISQSDSLILHWHQITTILNWWNNTWMHTWLLQRMFANGMLNQDNFFSSCAVALYVLWSRSHTVGRISLDLNWCLYVSNKHNAAVQLCFLCTVLALHMAIWSCRLLISVLSLLLTPPVSFHCSIAPEAKQWVW